MQPTLDRKSGANLPAVEALASWTTPPASLATIDSFQVRSLVMSIVGGPKVIP